MVNLDSKLSAESAREYLSSLTEMDLADRQWEMLMRQDWFQRFIEADEPRDLIIDSMLAFVRDCITLGFKREKSSEDWQIDQKNVQSLLTEGGAEYAKAFLIADAARTEEFERLKEWQLEMPFVSEKSVLRYLLQIQHAEYEAGMDHIEPGSGLSVVGSIWVKDGEGSSVELHYFQKNGILAKLAAYASELADRYSWTLSGAVSFIFIVREIPHIQKVRVSRVRGRIVLSIDPATSPRDVMKQYSELRASTVRHVQPIRQKNLLLALFALGMWRHIPWQERMDRFNEMFSSSLGDDSKPLYTELRYFKRDAIETGKRLLGPLGLKPLVDEKEGVSK